MPAIASEPRPVNIVSSPDAPFPPRYLLATVRKKPRPHIGSHRALDRVDGGVVSARRRRAALESPTCKWAVPKDHFRRCTRTLPRVLARADACTEVAGWRRPHLVHRLLDQRRPVPSSNASAMQRGAVSEVELQSRRVHVRGGTGMLALACRGLGQTNLRVIGTSRDHVLGQPPANSAPLMGEPPRHRRNSASHAPSADLIGGIPPPTRL